MAMERLGLMCHQEGVKISFLIDRYFFILKLHISLLYKEVLNWCCVCYQKAHVQQFLATEDALNKAAEARETCEKLMKRLHGSTDVSSRPIGFGSTSQNVGSLRQLEVLLRKTYSALCFLNVGYIFF